MNNNGYLKGLIKKIEISTTKLIISFLLLFFCLICLSIIVFPYIRQIFLFIYLKLKPSGTITAAGELKFNDMLIFLSYVAIILSIFIGIIIYIWKILIRLINNNILLFSYFIITILAIAIRIPGINFISGDASVALSWTRYLSVNNHLFGISTIASIGANYTPFYLYIVGLISFFPESLWLICIKIVSCLFDFFLSIICAKIILSLINRMESALIAYSAILLCPTVFINSSIWSQSDSIYVFFMFLSLLLFINDKNNFALFIFGISLSIKLQAIFMLPFIIILFLYKRYKITNIFYFIIGFMITPIIGFPFGSLKQFFLAYFLQVNVYSSRITFNAPTIFALFSLNSEAIHIMKNVGILFTLSLLVCFAIYVIFCIRRNRQYSDCSNIPFEKDLYIVIFFFITLAIPFLLPSMHERYFYAAEISSILFAVLFPKKWWITLIVILPSCATYFNYLFESSSNLLPLAIIMLIGVFFVTKWTINSIGNNSSKDL